MRYIGARAENGVRVESDRAKKGFFAVTGVGSPRWCWKKKYTEREGEGIFSDTCEELWGDETVEYTAEGAAEGEGELKECDRARSFAGAGELAVKEVRAPGEEGKVGDDQREAGRKLRCGEEKYKNEEREKRCDGAGARGRWGAGEDDDEGREIEREGEHPENG